MLLGCDPTNPVPLMITYWFNSSLFAATNGSDKNAANASIILFQNLPYIFKRLQRYDAKTGYFTHGRGNGWTCFSRARHRSGIAATRL
jgi:hypothetical protein